MAKSCKKCDPHEICEECPEWIFTLADLIMCMMGLFVLLWVLKPAGKDAAAAPNDEDWLKVVAKIREAFDYLPDPQSTDPVDQFMLMQKLQQMKPLKGPGDGGKTRLDRKGAEGDQPEVISVRRGTQAIVGSRVLFEAASATLTPESNRILDQIAQMIKGHKNIMLIRGHTSLDDYPEGTDAQQQLDLSIRRAKVVADYLVKHGVAPEILRVLGCSTFEPVIQRAYTPELKQQNRRVEVEATTTLVAELQDPAPSARPASERTIEESAAPKQPASTASAH